MFKKMKKKEQIIVIKEDSKVIHIYNGNEFRSRVKDLIISGTFIIDKDSIHITGKHIEYELSVNISTINKSGKELFAKYAKWHFVPKPYKTGFLRKRIIRKWDMRHAHIQFAKRNDIEITLSKYKYDIIIHNELGN